MQLIYKINFNSTNFYYKDIIDSIIKECALKAHTKMYKGFILLICNDKAELIEDFFKILEQKLPLSIFLGETQVIEEFDFDSFEELENKNVKINLSLLTNDEIRAILEENKIDFSNDINKIKEGGVSRFETHNGLKDFFLPNKVIRESFEKRGFEVKLLITNINAITNILDISQKDLQVLCSIERPLVKLEFKLPHNTKAECSNTRFIYAKIPDDKETVLFSTALKEEGIDYLLYVNDEVYQDGLKVTYNDKQNIILHGEKGLFPKYDYICNRKINSSADYFEEYGSVFKASIAQLNKSLVPIIGVYFSQKSEESAIKVNLPNIGEKDIVCIPNAFNNFNKCLEDIKSIDEDTKNLVINYKHKFPKLLEKEPKNANTYGFESILNLLAYIIGLKDAKAFEDLALIYSGKNKLQIDMKLVEIEGKNYLDYKKIIQSTIKHKIACVENSLLAYSFYESLCEFIINKVSEVKNEIKAKDLILCGDMIGNLIIQLKLRKKLKIFIPKEYPIDY